MPRLKEVAVDLASAYKLRIVPLHDRDKLPRIKDWQNQASADVDTVEAWWDQWPDANIGVLLGPTSGPGIIDVEYDSNEGHRTARKLFANTSTPTYQSDRSVHRLFLWKDDYGLPPQAKIEVAGLEIRHGAGDKGAQSVFPPSIHPSSAVYQWLPGLAIGQVDFAEFPEGLVSLLRKELYGIDQRIDRPGKKSARARIYERQWIVEGADERDNTIYAEACAMLGELVRSDGLAALDDPEKVNMITRRLWCINKAMCKPPLDDDVVRTKIESALGYIKGQSVKEHRERGGIQYAQWGLEYRDGEWFPGKWRVVRIKSDPPRVRLFTPFLGEEGVTLTMEEYDSPRKVHLAVLSATGNVCLDDRPAVWPGIWNGTKTKKDTYRGVKAKLLDVSGELDAPPEEIREAIIAEHILAILSNTADTENSQPDANGLPTQLEDGAITVGFGVLHEALSATSDKISRNEVSAVLRKIEAEDASAGPKDRRVRLKKLSRKAISTLREMAKYE